MSGLCVTAVASVPPPQPLPAQPEPLPALLAPQHSRQTAAAPPRLGQDGLPLHAGQRTRHTLGGRRRRKEQGSRLIATLAASANAGRCLRINGIRCGGHSTTSIGGAATAAVSRETEEGTTAAATTAGRCETSSLGADATSSAALDASASTFLFAGTLPRSAIVRSSHISCSRRCCFSGHAQFGCSSRLSFVLVGCLARLVALVVFALQVSKPLAHAAGAPSWVRFSNRGQRRAKDGEETREAAELTPFFFLSFVDSR